MTWSDLPPGPLDPAHLARSDAYLRMAAGTGFADHLAAMPAGAALHCSVQLRQAMAFVPPPGVVVPPAHAGSAFFTARVTLAGLNALLAHPDVLRVQWAEGLLPQRPRGKPAMPWPAVVVGADVPSTASPSTLLLGVIDAGCPFAHADLRTPAGNTRIVRIWNQNDDPGPAPAHMGYGVEWTDAQLNAVMAACEDSTGSVDESACYRAVGAEALFGTLSHGAHALGLLGALRRYDGRPRPGQAQPVRLYPGDASQADMAFVELPRRVLDAPFPAAIQHFTLDALRYLLALGRARGCTEVVVSFAFESWLGPHDGKAWFDEAVQALITDAAPHLQLKVYFIAGNSGGHDVHQQLSDTNHTVQWRVPPDNQLPTHLEIWVPGDAALDDLEVDLTPPGQAVPLPALGWVAAVAWPNPAAAAACVVMDQTRVLGSADRVIVVRVAPTRVFDARQAAAPHGLWTLALRTSGSLNSVHAYIGRGTESAWSPPRGRQAAWQKRSAAAVLVGRLGSFNGHACHPNALVTTSCVSTHSPDSGPQAPQQPGHAAGYAGCGPSRNGGRQGPSFGVEVERGSWHRGFIGIGNRSGVTFRLVGTSVSAPLGARLVADGVGCAPGLPPTHASSPNAVGPCVRLPF